jgi:hypothetical protein
VTAGALERLNRDELQGVIAHEFSHVVNGDMRLNIRLIGLLFGILFLSIIGRTLLQGSFFMGGGRGRGGRSDSNNNPLPIIGIALLIAGGIGVFAGRIIQASVSRQREYLADTSAVQYTRQTKGLAGALKKIGGLGRARGYEARSGTRSATCFSGLAASSAPCSPRIRRLLSASERSSPTSTRPSCSNSASNGRQPTVRTSGGSRSGPGAGRSVARGAPDLRSQLPAASAQMSVDASAVVGQVATMSEAAQSRASTIIDQIPDTILAARGTSRPSCRSS